MIYEYAIEPAVAASWHDPAAWYPFKVQMGPGSCRVPCAFPAANWKKLAETAFADATRSLPAAEKQAARTRFTALLKHLAERWTRRDGVLDAQKAWVSAALAEHSAFPFGGIVAIAVPHGAYASVVAASAIHQGHQAWDRPAHPVPRTAVGLGDALAPLLQSATKIRFVDVLRRCGAGLHGPHDRVHTARSAPQDRDRPSAGDSLRPAEEEELNMPRGGGGTPTTLPALAQSKISDCRTHVAPLLKHGVSLGIFAWGQGPAGIEMHNRYVLTEIGGVGVHHGLDQGIAAKAELDDLTILSAEQHAEDGSAMLRLRRSTRCTVKRRCLDLPMHVRVGRWRSTNDGGNENIP